ncbi:MAG: outer membrane protein transport protein [Alphaproteobacteria bacterium]|nr:outer membrane protein transport protein [Alphaproteobacteria bacterium]
MSADVMAAGFHLREQSAAAQGNAYAGATAGAEDNSYTYYNVAGLTRHKGTSFTGGATYIAPKATAKKVRGEDGNRDADVHNVVHAAISPNFTISHQVNEKWFIGFAGNSPFGMITKYDKEWVGGDHGITSDVKTATFTPMTAYKVTDKFSIGAGVQIQYLWAHLTSSNKNLGVKHIATDGDALDLGYQLGALYEFNDATRVGIGYRSKINHKVKGDMSASKTNIPQIDGLLNQDISVRLTTPAMFSMGAYHDINDRWSVMAEYQRVFWSSFKHLNFVSKDGGYMISQVNEHWRDTNFFAVGTSYMLDEQWKLRLGLGYDQSAVRYRHRTPRIPDSDRVWYTIGLGYQYNAKLAFNVGYTYIQAHKASLNTKLTQNSGKNVTAEYDNSIQALAFGFTYNF